jgi:hypothetical protein
LRRRKFIPPPISLIHSQTAHPRPAHKRPIAATCATRSSRCPAEHPRRYTITRCGDSANPGPNTVNTSASVKYR